MNIKYCTFTGVDKLTDISRVIDMSKKYSFIEWAILYSPTKYHSSERYPYPEFILKFLETTALNNINIAIHFCGSSIDNIIKENDYEKELLNVINKLQYRVQLNFNQKIQNIDLDRLLKILPLYPNIQFITQHNKSNLTVYKKFSKHLKKYSVLFDSSGGRGIELSKIPMPFKGIFCGYAGGLGPDNLKNELEIISLAAQNNNIWIDMESNIRNIRWLDLDKCQICAEIVNEFNNKLTW